LIVYIVTSGSPGDGPEPFYGIPRVGVGPEGALKRYRGIDRDPLEPFSDEEVAMLDCLVAPRIEYEAQRRLAELEEAGRTDDDSSSMKKTGTLSTRCSRALLTMS